MDNGGVRCKQETQPQVWLGPQGCWLRMERKKGSRIKVGFGARQYMAVPLGRMVFIGPGMSSNIPSHMFNFPFRKRFGKDNVILSDIRKPSEHSNKSVNPASPQGSLWCLHNVTDLSPIPTGLLLFTCFLECALESP